METFYHGSVNKFDSFDLDGNILKGDGKIKFGYGVYVSSRFDNAAHYATINKEAAYHYVYTVEIPDKTETNHIAFKKPVHTEIISKAETKLNKEIPAKSRADGKEFRKFLVKVLSPKNEDKVRAEKRASEFLISIGVIYICWPHNWAKPEKGDNRAVLDDRLIKIVKCETTEAK